jgi:hypothetical protein
MGLPASHAKSAGFGKHRHQCSAIVVGVLAIASLAAWSRWASAL